MGRILVGAAAAAALVVGAAAPARADPPVPPAPPVAGQILALANIAPELGGVVVDSVGYRRTYTLYVFVRDHLHEVRQTREDADAQLASLSTLDARLAQTMVDATVRRKAAALELADLRERRRQLAVAGYVASQGASAPVKTLDLDSSTTAEEQRVLVRGLDATSATAQAGADAAFRSATNQIAKARAARDDEKATAARIASDRATAAATELQLTAELAQRRVDLDQARALSNVVGTDFTLVAMDAYWRAAIVEAQQNPDCGIAWWALAGIGHSESRHGTEGGAELRANGDETQPIIGIPLDGTSNTTPVADTDGGLWDGDALVDHAVGPMQFIPGTWRAYARDGNGDGKADPENMYDAALAAGDYLCKSAPLTDDAGLARAYYRYNHSDAYVRNVLAWAHRYATTDIPAPPLPDT